MMKMSTIILIYAADILDSDDENKAMIIYNKTAVEDENPSLIKVGGRQCLIMLGKAH